MALEESKTGCLYCIHYNGCYKLRHDRSVFDKGCEDFEEDTFFVEISYEQLPITEYVDEEDD